jgi:hypothetical protein
VFPGVAAALHAFAASLPAAAPFAVAAAAGFGVVATHVPGPDTITLKGSPELAAECMQRASGKSALAAVSQPLYGASTYGVVFKRGGVTGDPVMTAVVQESAGGSTVDFRRLAGGDLETDDLLKVIADCRAASAQ